jgi:hypothetical protein
MALKIYSRPSSRCRHRRRCGLFGLLAALGVLAFFFSVISPADDDVQQEFIQGNKPKQLAAANHKSADDGHIHGTNKVRYALIARSPSISCFTSSSFDVAEPSEIAALFQRNLSRDRAPPAQSLQIF